jgi:hydroxymethylpyrimidine pyrophosphatase-like HAD family hydrolase
MRYRALACDFDGTIAEDGQVEATTLEALDDVRGSGRRLILLTGRLLPDLKARFPELDKFDVVVAENGALLYTPGAAEERLIAAPVEASLYRRLSKAGIKPLDRGRVIVSTWVPNDQVVLESIRELGLDLQVIFNKGAVMVVPSGVNKATGLTEALAGLSLSPHNVVGIGDAENDLAFLGVCEFSAAVANAIPSVKGRVDFVSDADHGRGVADLASRLLEDDLASLPTRTPHTVPVGIDTRGQTVELPVWGKNFLFAGGSGSGKSSLAKTFIERLVEGAYQFCVIDPEGDYEDFEEGVVLGDSSRVPHPSEVLQILDDPYRNVVVNLLGVSLEDRPAYYAQLSSDLMEMVSRNGRPHWIVVDEAHHVLPRERAPGKSPGPPPANHVLVTLEPDLMQESVVTSTSLICAVGEEAQQTLRAYAKIVGEGRITLPKRKVPLGSALILERGRAVRRFSIAPTLLQHRRHRRKYAIGDLGPDLSFYFKGKDGNLNLRAQNLVVFSQLAAGLDDETWMFHLRGGDYSTWFRDVIKNEELAEIAAGIENKRVSAKRSRDLIRQAIAERYTLPAEAESRPNGG